MLSPNLHKFRERAELVLYLPDVMKRAGKANVKNCCTQLKAVKGLFIKFNRIHNGIRQMNLRAEKLGFYVVEKRWSADYVGT